MGWTAEHYCDLVVKLAHMHAHEDAKAWIPEVQKRMENPLDFDEVREVIETAADELEFVILAGDFVWLEQNRALLEFLEEDCGEDLQFISVRFDHLVPPSLREEFDLPPPNF